LRPAEFQGILPLPFRLQPAWPVLPIRRAPVHQRSPAAPGQVDDLAHGIPTAIQAHRLQPLQFPGVLGLPFGPPQRILFRFIEYKPSFRHTLYYATSFVFIHEEIRENAEHLRQATEELRAAAEVLRRAAEEYRQAEEVERLRTEDNRQFSAEVRQTLTDILTQLRHMDNGRDQRPTDR
jgi:hypothetical protein